MNDPQLFGTWEQIKKYQMQTFTFKKIFILSFLESLLKLLVHAVKMRWFTVWKWYKIWLETPKYLSQNFAIFFIQYFEEGLPKMVHFYKISTSRVGIFRWIYLIPQPQSFSFLGRFSAFCNVLEILFQNPNTHDSWISSE